ncbi:MAG: flagellin [Alphaproteobacteria bacterium]|nr:flagellin [Alphaproteobacteria bacterium]
MTAITLTASMRSNLSSLKTIQSQMDKTQERLSTGKKVNSAIDNASSYYQARALTNRASDLDALLDSMGQGIQTIQAANEGIEAVTAFVDQLKSIANTAVALDPEAETYSTSIANYKEQFDAIIGEIEKVVKDASYQGVNLLTGGKLTITFNESRSHSFDVQGDDVVAEMAITKAATKWVEDADNDKTIADGIDATLTEISKAVDYLRSYSTKLGNNVTVIETRQNFTDAMINVLETGSDNLVLADMNEESANYLALQTRQQLAINSLSLAAQSAQSILSLF